MTRLFSLSTALRQARDPGFKSDLGNHEYAKQLWLACATRSMAMVIVPACKLAIAQHPWTPTPTWIYLQLKSQQQRYGLELKLCSVFGVR